MARAYDRRVTILLTALVLLGLTPIEPTAPHVQGIDVDDAALWVTAVDDPARTGVLSRHDLASGRRVAAVDLRDGDRYHPGGIQVDGDAVWVPLAEYRRSSSTWIQKRNKHTLELLSQFSVADHIGCVAVADGVVWGGNWDSARIYRWREDGTLIDVRDNPTGTRYQDMKHVDGALVASGLRGAGEGAIDWLDPETLAVRRRIVTTVTDRQVTSTNEGMAVRGSVLYLLPEDTPSRLFRFRLP
jgi:hypothetical protein